MCFPLVLFIVCFCFLCTSYSSHVFSAMYKHLYYFITRYKEHIHDIRSNGLSYCPGICLKGLRITTEISHDTWWLSQDFNWGDCRVLEWLWCVSCVWLIMQTKLSLCLVKHHAMEMCRSVVTAPHILDSSSRWRWVVSFTPQPHHL
jgi:hypothetical protein